MTGAAYQCLPLSKRGSGRDLFLHAAPNELCRSSLWPQTFAPVLCGAILPGMRFEKVWIEQCRATKAIRRRFGAKSALDYLIGEKLLMFADAAKDDPTFAKELPR